MGVCSSNQKKKYKNKTQYETTISQNQTTDKTPINSTQSTQKEKKIINRLSLKTKFTDISNIIKIKDTFVGRGSSGIIREGVDINGKKYAIKSIFKNDLIKNMYYKREVEITLNLDHENIIKCYNIYEDKNSLHFVLELCEGGDLFDYILNHQNNKIEENEAIALLEQMLKSLIYLHEEVGIVHRDIKPENFLISNINGKKIIKLTDFGFSDYLPKKHNNNLTKNLLSEQLGTPQYAAPEIYEGKEYDSKVDLWSLGVVLYNMINGTQLFGHSKGDNIKNDVLYKKINFTNFKNPLLKNLAMKLLERNPEKRLNACQALCQLKLIKDYDDTMTIPDSFNPNIQTIINIDNNNYYSINKLRDIFIEFLPGKNLEYVVKNLKQKYKKQNNNINLYSLINDCLNLNLNVEFKKKVEKFKKENKLNEQMVDLNKFFSFVIEAQNYIQKQKILNTFKTLDIKNKGFLYIHECLSLFNKNELKNLPEINDFEKIDFGKFFNYYIEYKHIYLPSLVICS